MLIFDVFWVLFFSFFAYTSSQPTDYSIEKRAGTSPFHDSTIYRLANQHLFPDFRPDVQVRTRVRENDFKFRRWDECVMSNYLWTYNPTSGMVFTVVTNMGPAIFNLDKTTISQMTVRGKEELKADKYEELVGGPYTGSNGRITITFRQLQEQYKHYGIPIRIFEAKLEWPWYQGSKNPDGVWLYPSVRAKLKDSLRRTLSAFDPSNWRMKEVKLDYKARPNSDDAYTGRMISGVFFERPLGGDWNKAQYRTLTGAEYTIPNKGRGKAITPASANPVYLDLYYGTWNRAR